MDPSTANAIAARADAFASGLLPFVLPVGLVFVWLTRALLKFLERSECDEH